MLEEKDILQVNATLIAGAFIFLSLSLTVVSEFRLTSSSNQTSNSSEVEAVTSAEKAISNIDLQILVAYGVIVPFATSSIIAIYAHRNPAKRESRSKNGIITTTQA
jgi:hypothetical protein